MARKPMIATTPRRSAGFADRARTGLDNDSITADITTD
jgi:hypothetical protein